MNKVIHFLAATGFGRRHDKACMAAGVLQNCAFDKASGGIIRFGDDEDDFVVGIVLGEQLTEVVFDAGVDALDRSDYRSWRCWASKRIEKRPPNKAGETDSAEQ